MWNARLDEAQAGIKTARRNVNNLRYADDTTLMAEIEEDKISINEDILCIPREICMQARKQQLELAMKTLKNGQFPSWERSTSRLYIVTLLIY